MEWTNVLSDVLAFVNPKLPIFLYTVHMSALSLAHHTLLFLWQVLQQQSYVQQRQYGPVYPPSSVAVSELPAVALVAIADAPAVNQGDWCRAGAKYRANSLSSGTL